MNTGRPCSIADALRIVGERWALLAIREISFGNRRFDEIARNTGASRDILTTRLRSLEAAGVITRRRYSDRPPRFEYHLTEAGRDLRMILNLLREWGDRWLADEPPVAAAHTCGHPLDLVFTCRHCGAEVRPEDIRLTVNSPDWELSGPTSS
ncbi:helix-turn-helix domain-containing protein [Actinocorallia sp. B10E7]|uniref:winged helix-turn-helix transcriptional regulator n=1 Tax=Actinocorallia sp. B10E7 TaxID=3153558 RepID=UPI00325CD1E9